MLGVVHVVIEHGAPATQLRGLHRLAQVAPRTIVINIDFRKIKQYYLALRTLLLKQDYRRMSIKIIPNLPHLADHNSNKHK